MCARTRAPSALAQPLLAAYASIPSNPASPRLRAVARGAQRTGVEPGVVAVHGAEARGGEGRGGRLIADAPELGVQLLQVPRILDGSPDFAIISAHEHEHGRCFPS